ncbi:uncharacterized protein [Procambarus clarkii]|uniref:uncharacterized protein isoform X2 n=1 Tax=Procambarus clarkii TaxID=6728 RepID=UPI001E6709C1|nr:uncharacterized protein LOC123746562 isoform X2 [Procambarus clarkii]
MACDDPPAESDTPGEADGHTARPVSFERPSSLVENEDVDVSSNNSILSAITFESDSNTFPGTSGKSRTSSASSSWSSSPTPPPASPVKRAFTRRSSRASGFTLNLSDKFVTELTMYDPCVGAVQGSSISLGIFLATDQVMGDHFVYKVSPVSPLAVLKMKPQDRLIKLNDLSLEGWSHRSVLAFVRNLPLACVSGQVTPDTVVDFRLCLELRRTGKNVRSPDEAPVNKKLDVSIRIKKKRASVMWVQEREAQVQYRGSITRKLRLRGDLPLYLTTTSHPNTAVTSLSVGSQEGADSPACFLMHTFDMAPFPAEGGEVVVIETPGSKGHLHALTYTDLALMHDPASDVRSLTQADVRFFLLHSVKGSSHFRIKHLHTGRFVSATPEKISLVERPDDADLSETTLFEVFDCQT